MEEKDKRVYKRLRMELNMRYRILQPNLEVSDEHLTTAQNLSAGGLAFCTNEKLRMGLTLQLAVELPISETPIVCLSRITRIEGPLKNGSFMIGVCFLDMTSSDRTQLDQFVKEEVS